MVQGEGPTKQSQNISKLMQKFVETNARVPPLDKHLKKEDENDINEEVRVKTTNQAKKKSEKKDTNRFKEESKRPVKHQKCRDTC